MTFNSSTSISIFIVYSATSTPWNGAFRKILLLLLLLLLLFSSLCFSWILTKFGGLGGQCLLSCSVLIPRMFVRVSSFFLTTRGKLGPDWRRKWLEKDGKESGCKVWVRGLLDNENTSRWWEMGTECSRRKQSSNHLVSSHVLFWFMLLL